MNYVTHADNKLRRISPEDEYLGIAKNKLLPLMNQIMDPDTSKELAVRDNQLCINGVPVGEWRLISQYRLVSVSARAIAFRYGSRQIRKVYFGSSAFSDDPDRVVQITETDPDQQEKVIYCELR